MATSQILQGPFNKPILGTVKSLMAQRNAETYTRVLGVFEIEAVVKQPDRLAMNDARVTVAQLASHSRSD